MTIEKSSTRIIENEAMPGGKKAYTRAQKNIVKMSHNVYFATLNTVLGMISDASAAGDYYRIKQDQRYKRLQ